MLVINIITDINCLNRCLITIASRHTKKIISEATVPRRSKFDKEHRIPVTVCTGLWRRNEMIVEMYQIETLQNRYNKVIADLHVLHTPAMYTEDDDDDKKLLTLICPIVHRLH